MYIDIYFAIMMLSVYKIVTTDFKKSAMLLMHIKNNAGPKIEACGTTCV